MTANNIEPEQHIVRVCDTSGKLLAIVLKNEFESEGIQFLTEDSDPFQLGYMKRDAGYKIQPHLHVEHERIVFACSECLFIKSGRVRISFYSETKEELCQIEVKKDDVILLVAGGHGFEFLEKSEIIEVKQGPYMGNADKMRF